MTEKTCKVCNETKLVEDFMPRKLWCRICWNKKRSEDRKKKKEALANMPQDGTKVCSQCKIEKPISEMYPNTAQCKDCVNAKRRIKRQQQRQAKIDAGEIKNIPKEVKKKGHKHCPYCDKIWPDWMFRKNRRKCTDCERSDGKRYRKTDKGRKKSKAWANNNKKRNKELQHNWYVKHREVINAKNKDRYHSDPDYNFKRKMKELLRVYIINRKCKYKGKKNYYVDMHRPQFIEWLEHNFDENMTFDNYGKYWHMDHVIPINTFDLDDPFEKELCFNWKNVAPLLGPENMSKHDKINKNQLLKHFNNVTSYCEKNNINFNLEYDEYACLCATHLVAGTSR